MTITAKTRAALHERAQDCCERCGVHGATNAHHRRNQSQGGHDGLSNLMLLCGSGTTGCHGFVTTEPAIARRLGWNVRRISDPADIEVWRFDLTLGVRVPVKLDDDGNIHPSSIAEQTVETEGTLSK
jgi:hypothetical protein